MLNASFSRQLVDANAPIDLSFFADGESVRVNEGGIGASEYSSDIGVVVAAEGDNADVWEGGEVCGLRGVNVTR